ncbi:MAG TPA: hypothetical protein VFX50_10080 [Gemmatimonadales bacterium]|nr:hypothetical protein [Gemmatimonadales bacterium]
MSENAATQLRRILALIPEFADDQEHSLDDVARRLGVTRKTLVSDLQDLVERWDDPGGFTAGVQVYLTKDGVSLFTDHFNRPMRLTVA